MASFISLPGSRLIFELSKKSTVIALRWPVVIICSYLLVYGREDWSNLTFSHVALLFYVLSNAILYRFDERLFDSSYFYVPLVIFDTLVLTGSMIVSGRVSTDFYLTYFLIIILCAMWHDFLWSIGVAVLVSILYGFILFQTTEIYDPTMYLRFPFLFVTSLFYGYFSQMVQGEKALKQQAEIDRWRAVANLAAGVAHEVKNPLAILLQGIEYLSNQRESNDPEAPSVLKDMKEAIQRANAVIRGLMDFSSIAKLNIVQEDLNSIVEDSLLLLKNHFDRHHTQVIRELRRDIPSINADKLRIEQVFINLFMNAIEAMPNGGRLWVRTYAREQKENGMVIAEIENEGSAIPEEVLPRIFEPFFTTKRGTGGTGLGLSVVKNILDTHRTKIEIRNRQNGGVRVTLLFPTQP